MIDLDDPIWSELNHCYGSGEDVPPNLRQIETSKKLSAAFWDDFTNTLCHQNTIGTASIAAFPHLVRIAGDDVTSRKAFDSLQLAATILMLALGPENKLPKMDNSLQAPFCQAITDGRRIVMAMYDQKRRTVKDSMLYLGMVAAFDMRADISCLLSELCLGWHDCPQCEERIEMDDLCNW